MDRFDAVSPLEFRYLGSDPALKSRLGAFLSEEAFVTYCLRVEVALVRALAKLGVCQVSIADEVQRAAAEIGAEEVYEEEQRTGHQIAALVNCLRRRLREEARPFVHLFATSSDISDTATALRLRDALRDAVGPDLISLGEALATLADKEKDTVQVGRTHGVHAEPVTFGYAVSLYLDRIGQRLEALETARQNLRGKLSGAVGTYAAAGLAFPSDHKIVESTALELLGISPTANRASSQIVQPEYVVDLIHTLTSTFSVLAQIADDFRNLHRTEIGEVSLSRSDSYIGSSTMPHKENPAALETIKSLWKAFIPRVMTVYMDQVSEHQRDLTNSASSRFLPEYVAAFDYAVVSLTRTLADIRIDREAMLANLRRSAPDLVAEPLYICLALNGHPDASEAVRQALASSKSKGQSLLTTVREDPGLEPYLRNLSSDQMAILEDVQAYTGQASDLAREVSSRWTKAFESMQEGWTQERSDTSELVEQAPV